MKSLMGLVFAAAGALSAATLNVELTVSHGIELPTGAQVAKNRRVAYFVIDRSGSMNDATLEGGRTPNDALLESLKMRLDSLPNGTSVYVIPFASIIRSTRPYHELNADIRKKIYDFVANDKPQGCTLLYDAQDLALTDAARTMQRDPGAEVSVYVYTDGKQETPWDYKGDYPARTLLRKKSGLRYKSEYNPNYVQENKQAFNNFKKKFADFIQRPNLEIEYEWLSRSAKPDTSKWGEVPRIGTEFSLQATELKNPRTEPEQTLKCHFHIPITDSCWDEIKGRRVSLDFVIGEKYCSRSFELGKDGVVMCKLDWPSLPEDSTVARITLSRMPKGKKFELKAPKPLELRVPAQGKTPVAIVDPPNNTVVAVGESVTFAARVSDNAKVKWTIPNGTVDSPAKPEVKWTAQTPGLVAYSVTASQTGLKDDTAKGVLEVIQTGAKIITVGRYEVGTDSVFRAETKGECRACAWSVDGKPVTGSTGKELKFLFEEPGRHRVGLTALYKKGITKEAEVREIDVSEKPFLKVSSPVPYGGDESVEYKAGKPIDLLATVKGELTSVDWAFTVKGKTETVQTKVERGCVVGPKFMPKKGGLYEVAVTAKGPAGTKTETFQALVKSEDVVVSIKRPKANDEIVTGKSFELVAAVKGPAKAIQWKLVDKSTAREVSFGPSKEAKVIDGASEPIKAKLPLELGDTSVEILAEPILDDEELSETVSVSSLIISVVTKGEIRIAGDAMKKNWRRIKYGEQETLAVEKTGAVSEVSWFTEENGKIVPIGNGDTINVPVVKPDGMSERSIAYFAKGKMPDGSFKATEHLVLTWCCPCSLGNPPPVRIDLSSTKVGRNEPVTARLVGDEVDAEKRELADVGSIAWYVDGKEYRKGCREVELKFDKTQYGDHEIAVACKCRMCTRSLGDAGAAMTIAVVHKPPVAKFEMDPKPGDRTANPWTVRLKCVSTGDVDYRIWKCDGAAIGGASNQVEVSVCAPLGRGTHRYSLEVGSDDGKKSEAAPQEINVWNFWLLLVFLAIALSVAGFFWWYFSGDDPRFWKVFGFVDETNSKGVQDVEAEMLSFTLIKEYWDTLRNRATIPLHKLGGAQSDDWGNGTTLGQTGLVLWEAKTAGDTLGVRMPNYNLMNPPEGMERDSYSNGQLIRIWAPSPSKPPSMTTLWVKIIMPGVVPNTYLWFRLGILLACLVAVAVFSWLFVF